MHGCLCMYVSFSNSNSIMFGCIYVPNPSGKKEHKRIPTFLSPPPPVNNVRVMCGVWGLGNGVKIKKKKKLAGFEDLSRLGGGGGLFFIFT